MAEKTFTGKALAAACERGLRAGGRRVAVTMVKPSEPNGHVIVK